MKKKSQMEIMGLAIIIILITLGVLFVVQFVVLREPSDIKKTFTETQMAANMLNSILKTTSKDCYDSTIVQLLKDCAEHSQSPSGLVRCENDASSCEYANSTIDYIFNKTLVVWGNRSFYFKSYVGASDIILEKGRLCTGEVESKQSFISTDAGILTIRLDLCS